MLVTKCKTGTWLALAICFGTLTADRFLLITLELPLTASQAVYKSGKSRGARVDKDRHTNQSETSCLGDDGYEFFFVVEWQCHVECMMGMYNEW